MVMVLACTFNELLQFLFTLVDILWSDCYSRSLRQEFYLIFDGRYKSLLHFLILIYNGGSLQ